MTTTTALTHPTISDHTTPQTEASVPPQSYGSPTDGGNASVVALREHVASIWKMTRAQRVDAYASNELTREQIQEWTGRAPSELPLINGEFAHIAATTPEACFRCPICGDDEVTLATGGVLSSHPDYRHPNWGKPAASTTGDVPVCPGSGTRPDTTKGVVA